MGEALGVVVQRLLRLVNRRCFTAFGLWCTRQFRRTVVRGFLISSTGNFWRHALRS